MFTGIITDTGRVISVLDEGGRIVRMGCNYITSDIDPGASIACDGVCLTVTRIGPDYFDVDISMETLSKTTLGSWQQGDRVNLERALRVGDELGGHIVSGHVDGVAEITDMHEDGASTRVTLRAPAELARFIAPKGSVALNGTSLTVNDVDGTSFGINIIPHTRTVTTWGAAAIGNKVNLEIDTLARYVARLAEMDG